MYFLDDQWLLAFLRGCKFSLERTKEKLDMYYTVRTLTPEYFSDRDPMRPEIQAILKKGSVTYHVTIRMILFCSYNLITDYFFL